MTRNEKVEWIKQKLRSSHIYTLWVRRNKALGCIICGTEHNLELHHEPAIEVLIRSLMNLFYRKEDILMELKNSHINDQVSCYTLCEECHEKRHKTSLPSTKPPSDYQLRVEPWCVIPHPLEVPLAPSRSHCPKGAIGLVALQTLFGIGYLLLNGQFEDRIHQVNYRRFAELIGKKPTTSFAKLLDGALRDLQRADIVDAYMQSGSMFEIHLSKKYIKRVRDNYWFISLRDVPSRGLLCLAIKHILDTQRNYVYKISMEKLCQRTKLSFKNPAVARKYVKAAVKHIPWASVKIEENMCTFTKRRKGYAPIHDLREILEDSLKKNR